MKRADEGRNAASRRRLSLEGAAYEVALTPLPFPGWSLVTIIPEAEFLGAVETTLRRLIIGLAVGALLAALLSADARAVGDCGSAYPRRGRNPACGKLCA